MKLLKDFCYKLFLLFFFENRNCTTCVFLKIMYDYETVAFETCLGRN